MENIISVCVSNRKEYENGASGGEWLTLPATADQLKKALENVDADKDNFFISEWESPLFFLNKMPDGSSNLCEHDIDKLNYLAVCLNTLDDMEIRKLNAIMSTSMYFERVGEIIDYTHNNSNCFILLDNLDAVVETIDQSDGFHTEYGYITCSGNTWKPYFENSGLVPEQYRITE